MKAGIFNTRIEKILDLGIQETRHFKLIFEPGADFDFTAGQFVNVIADIPGQPKPVKRPYSIDSPPYEKGYIDLVWKRVKNGLMTSHLWTLKKGDPLTLQGPLGRFGFKQPMARHLIFVATGTGIAPFRSMILQLFKEGTDRETWLFFGNRYEGTDVLYETEWRELAARHPNFHFVPTVSRPKPGGIWKGETVYVQHLLPKYLPSESVKEGHTFICGLTDMIMAVQDAALGMGFTKDQIFFEKYD